MTLDIVRELGHLTLGTRLKRLGERLQAQTQAVLGEADISLPASHLVVLAALDRLGPLSVGEVAGAVGISQPGISRMVENLRSDGFVTSRRAAGDRRVRPIVMTETGRAARCAREAPRLAQGRSRSRRSLRGRSRTVAGATVRAGGSTGSGAAAQPGGSQARAR